MGASVIIAAAGSAQRMKGTDKILFKICGREILSYSIAAFDRAKCTDKIVVVTSSEKINAVKKLAESLKLKTEIEVTQGAGERQYSVLKGLERCEKSSDCIMIHDAARPMITAAQIDFLYDKVINEGLKAAALGMPVKDTIKAVDKSGKIIATPDRSTLYITQTPQAFELSLYKKAVEQAVEQNAVYTDDCQLVEAIGESVYMVEGSYKNIKITTQEDLLTAENFLKETL